MRGQIPHLVGEHLLKAAGVRLSDPDSHSFQVKRAHAAVPETAT